jgi:dolichol-phosphate mannosyltransferase
MDAMAPRSVLAAAQALAAAVVLGRLGQGRRRRPALSAGADEAAGAGAPAISVVVPARDEAARIEPCLEGLLADPGLLEVIVVDDGSSDDTAALARAAGAAVVAGAPLPAGWTGKAWALQQGIEAARGELVLHVDADVRPRPGLARALAAAMAAGGDDVLSAGPAFRCRTAADLVLHPAFLATLPYRYGIGDAEGRRPRPSRAVINGQCVLVPRERFLAAGGYGRVRGNMTEDLALARSLAADGWAVGFVDGAALLETEMYVSARETLGGWGRSIAGADVTAPAALAADVATVWLTMALPVARLLARRRLRPVDRVLLAVRALLAVQLATRYRPRSPLPLLAPLADPLVAARITLAAVRPARSWRGRRYGARGRAGR